MSNPDVIRIDGRYYDTKKLAAIHPGGDIFVLIANGQDGTALFNSSHRREFPHEKYQDYLVGEKTVPAGAFEAAPTQNYDLYFEIADAVKPLIKNGGFAPTYYFLKVAVILAAALALEFYGIVYGRTLPLALLTGTVFAFIGLNVQHDANHGAVSRNGMVNRLLGLSQDFIGGSALSWMIFHDTVHHVHCNDTKRDLDLQIPLMRLHKGIPWQMAYTVQQVYMWLLEATFGVVHIFQAALWTVTGPQGNMRVLKSHWLTHQLMLLVTFGRIAAAMYYHPTWEQLGYTALQYMFGGLYLAFFFIISHNFNGAKKEGVDSQKGCFVRNQVETSSNVGGWVLGQMNGGLNYQIEHHLFPRVHHSNYHWIAPTVRRICEKHGIQYMHFPTIWENLTSTMEHMRIMGSKP